MDVDYSDTREGALAKTLLAWTILQQVCESRTMGRVRLNLKGGWVRRNSVFGSLCPSWKLAAALCSKYRLGNEALLWVGWQGNGVDMQSRPVRRSCKIDCSIYLIPVNMSPGCSVWFRRRIAGSGYRYLDRYWNIVAVVARVPRPSGFHSPHHQPKERRNTDLTGVLAVLHFCIPGFSAIFCSR